MSAVHHSNLDVYEYVPELDLQHNARLVAYLVYCLAQQDQLLPRLKFNSPAVSLKGNTTFELEGFSAARQVSLVGDFNDWNMFGTPMAKTSKGWICRIDLPKGKYVYKFIVDGSWTADPTTPKEKLVGDGKGHQGLTERIIE
jgi:1,4-alpha-glucan branching enzyme